MNVDLFGEEIRDHHGRALVTGHTSGLGKLIAEHLTQSGWIVDGWSLPDVNLASEQSVQAGAYSRTPEAPYDAVINCAGVNYINWHEETPVDQWDRMMNTNARAIWLVVKELLLVNGFMKDATVVNIVSNASHMPMTNSAAYNASKGAAHILTLQMARELKKRHGLTVFGVSPNKLKGTGMSEYIDERVCELRGWTPEEAEEYQRASLPAGEETDPWLVAEFIAFLLSSKSRHKFLHGCIIPYGA